MSSVPANARMIVLARESEGMTQSSLAHLSGVSQGLVSKIENGLEEPSDDVLAAMAEACGVPVDFFFQSDEIMGGGLVDFYHKKRLTLPAKPLKKANARANVRRLEAVRVLRTLEFSEVSPFPVFPIDEHQNASEIAEMVRAMWRVPEGPLANLVALIEATGVPVFFIDLGHEKLSAISMPGVHGRHVIIVNSALAPSAQRFALAHELGHLVMHDGVASESMEREADEFASALLMPARQVKKELWNLKFRDLGALKARWKVSLAALIRRAHDLGTISDRQYRTFNIELNKLPGGRKHEPGEFDPEQPRLMTHLLRHYTEELGYTREDLRRLMVTTESRLNREYFGEPGPAVRPVGSRRKNLYSVPVTSAMQQN